MPDLAELHFLRPWWLLGLLPPLLLWWIVSRREDVERQWGKIIAPHLLAHLKVGGEQGWRFRPLHLIVAALLLGAVGAAGPTWEREVAPFAEEAAPLVIALDLSVSMNAVDVQPTRLERAKQKVRDLLAERVGSRTALIAYAGSAHTVLPLCDDPSVFETFLASLETELMPVEGKAPQDALALAESLLAKDETPGSILFVTDGIAAEQAPAFAAHAERSDDALLVLAVGTRDGGPIRTGDSRFATDAAGRRIVATLDLEGLDALKSQAGAFVAGATVDDADVGRIQRRVQSHLRAAQQEDETARWKDQGYWFTLPVVLLALLWFRKGWTIRWSAVALVSVLFTGCAPSLWLTPDQQGRAGFERGEFAEAAAHFDDSRWKGASFYRAEEYEEAADWFARENTPEASYNLGNAYAMLERYDEALAAYETALVDRPDWREAIENRDRVREVVEKKKEEEEEEEGGEPNLSADEIQFDEKGKKGKSGEVEMEKINDEQLAEMWMRRLQTTPGDFLRRRFATEAAVEEQP